jgi:hypothetical protein
MANVEPISMHKDHKGMAQFQSADDEDFQHVSSIVQNMIEEAPSEVQTRWINLGTGTCD